MPTNQELYNKFFKEVDIDETELLSMVTSQYDEGFQFANSKRTELQANLDYYKNVVADGEVGDETTYSTVNALMARSITEEFKGEFEAGNPRDQIIVDNLNAVLQQDYDDDDMLAVDLYGNFFRLVMGVYIKVAIWWDGKKKANKFNYVDPRIWIPDPNGNYATGEFAYSGFETFVGEYAIEKDWLNKDSLKPFDRWFGTASMQKYLDQQTSNLQNVWVSNDNKYYDIYYHYFYITDKKGNQRKAMCITGNDKTLILKLELIESWVKDIEAEFPFSFEYYGFEPNNPLGDNVINHTAEPQKIKALNRNLRIKKSKAELYPMYFYNDKYLDKNKLSFWFNKFIPVSTKQDGAVSLDSIITAFRPDTRADNSYLIDQDLDKQLEKATSIGANIQWGTQDARDNTATEAGIIQSNSDVNIAYREKIANIGKKQFIRVWLQGYIKNFKDADSKIVILDNWVGATPIELKKRDFLTSAYHRIKVKSRTQIEMQRRKEIQALSQLVNIVMSMENIDGYQKTLLLRDYAEALWYSKNKILTRLAWSPEEELIKNENEVLSTGAYLETNDTDNHLMHILLQKPNQNANIETVAHFMTHIQEWIATGKQINSSWWAWAFQSIQASMASQNAAQLNQSTPITTNPS